MSPLDAFRSCLAMLSAAAGLIHFSAAPSHFAESPLHGSFFVVAGLLQIVAAGLLLRGGGTPLLRAVTVGNALVLAVWAMSRTTGVPVGPERWTPEPVGFADATCSLLEGLLVAGSLLLLSARGRRALEGARPRRSSTALVVTAASALFVLTAFSVVALGIGGDVHAGAHLAEASDGGGALAGHAHTGAAGHAAEGAASTHGGATSDHAHAAAAAQGNDHGHPGGSAPAHADQHQTSAGGTAHAHPATAPANHTHTAGGPHGSHHEIAGAPAPTATVTPSQPIGPGPGDRRTIVRYGPFVLPPASLGELLHLNVIQPTLAKPCSNCYVTSMTPDLVYADGTTANLDTGPMLHHAVWTRPLVPDATCGTGGVLGLVGERFFASGNERTPWTMPAGFGYLVGDDPWVLVTEIMNHSEELKIVFVELEATHRPAPDTSVKPVKPVWMDVANCSSSEYHIPAGPSETAWTWTSSVTGRIVATAGHLHDGGTKISLVNESTGRHVCTSAAWYGTKPGSLGSLDSMSVCAWDALGTVRAGEVLGLHSHYVSARAADDVMGIMLVYVHPTLDLDGGMAAPDAVREPAVPQAPTPPPAHAHH